MSGYDAWKTESREDYEERHQVHRTGRAPIPENGGLCACGELTSRMGTGVPWQCRDCAEAALRRQFSAIPICRCPVITGGHVVKNPHCPVHGQEAMKESA